MVSRNGLEPDDDLDLQIVLSQILDKAILSDQPGAVSERD